MLADQTRTGLDQPDPCPLTGLTLQSSKWELGDVLMMENHIATQTICQHTQLKNWILPEPLQGSSPLLIACDKGNFESVKHIVENWGVDINATASFHFFYKGIRMKVLGASPLFVAAYRCHYEIVRYLVQKGADIYAETSNDDVDSKLAGLTPFYGSIASLDSTFSIRQQQDAIVRFLLESGGSTSSALALLTALQKTLDKPIWKMRGCGPEATITLIKYGMSVNERSTFGTILTHWASKSLCYNGGSDEGSVLELVQLLLEKGMDPASPDVNGHTPLFLAAVPGYRIRSLNFSVFDFLLERQEIGRLDKINALELAGAVILSFSSDAAQVPRAFAYWRRAHHLRYQMGVDPIPKTPLIFKKVPQRVEWTTLPQLEEIEKDPSLHKIASLLVYLRMISVSDEWRYGYSYLHKTPVGLVMYHYEEGLHQLFTEAADSFFIVLEFILKCNNRRQFNLWRDTVKIDRKLVALLEDDPDSCTSEILQTSAELITAADQSHLPELKSDFFGYYANIVRHVITLLRFVSVLATHPEKMNDGIMNSLTQLVKQDGRTKDGSNLLLLACSYPQCTDLPPVVRLLLRARANPNAVDLRLRGPLHILAGFNYADQERIDHLGNLLVNKGAVDEGNCGAHPYMVDDEGRTAADIWLLLRNQGPRRQEDHRIWDRTDLPEWCVEDVPKLACLSAKIVRRLHIPYVDEIPATLYPFLEKH